MPAKSISSVFWYVDPFFKTEFIVSRLKGAEHRDWMMLPSGIRRAIVTGQLSKPSLLEVVSMIVGVRPVIVVYLKRTGKTNDDDNLVVY